MARSFWNKILVLIMRGYVMIRNKLYAFCIFSFLLFVSCNSFYNGDYVFVDDSFSLLENKWTILVYMSADNNLEAAAIEDLLEMEKSRLNTKEVTVLVLLDRNPSYDASNGNWSNTKLFRLRTGSEEKNKEFISDELECSELGLFPHQQNELDMSSYMNFSRIVRYMYENYPAKHYGVIFWGHGEGWRGFCYDGTSETRMTLQQMKMGLKNSLNSKKLDFIGFDTCFGAEMEVFYQIREFAKISFGIEGLLEINGMDYEEIFNLFALRKEKTVSDLIDAFLTQYKNSYDNYGRTSFSVIDLEYIQQMCETFNNLCTEVSKLMLTDSIRNSMKQKLFYSTNKFYYEESDSDVYIDVDSFVTIMSDFFASDENIRNCREQYFDARNKSVIEYWNSGGDSGSLGVYFSTLTEGNYLGVNHPMGYVKGRSSNQIDFVNDFDGYVPTISGDYSLLDKIFYK